MKFSHLESADCTDTGRKRKHNEDSLLRIPEQGIFCVADGMGGTFGGEVASNAAVEGLRKEFQQIVTQGATLTFEERVAAVNRALNAASKWIRNHADEIGVTGTGTTAIVLIFDSSRPERAAVLHAGDSRAYRIRQHKLEQLTMDHSVAAAAGVKSDKALPAMFRGVVTRAVGLEKEVLLEETPVDVEPGDLFMMCSDGLNKMVPDKTIARLIKEDGAKDLNALSKLLVDTANAAGGEDNTTVLLIRVASTLPPASPTHEETAAPDVETAESATRSTNAAVTVATQVPRTAVEERPPERKSDPDHMSGITPVGAGETDTPTPVTSEFQRDKRTATKTPQPDREADRASALNQIAAGKRQNLLMMACGAVVVIALVVTGVLLLRGRHRAEPISAPAVVETPAPAAATTATPAPEPAPVVVEKTPETAPTQPAPEPPPAVPVVAAQPEPVPAPPEPAPEPAPGPSLTSQADFDAAQSSFKVDVLEATMTGNWSELEAKMAELSKQYPGFGEGLPEWAIANAWVTEWKKADAGPAPASQAYEELKKAIAPIFEAVGANVKSIPAPTWQAAAVADASVYCSAIHSLEQKMTEAIDAYAAERVREADDLSSTLMPTATWMQKAEPDPSAANALSSFNATAANLQQWSAHVAAAKMPPAADLFAEAATGIENVEKRKDDFYDRLVDAIRRLNIDKAGWGVNQPPAIKGKVYEIGILRVRIVNVRARYKTDVRGWRVHEGLADVMKFFKLVDTTFPRKE